MSIVHPDLPGARVLDLYAGSGALGLEALSRGAATADFVELAPAALRAIRENGTALGALEQMRIHRGEALRYAEKLDAGAFDIAFADPPYGLGMAPRLAALWLRVPFAAILGIEHDVHEPLPDGGETRVYGGTAVTLYRLGDQAARRRSQPNATSPEPTRVPRADPGRPAPSPSPDYRFKTTSVSPLFMSRTAIYAGTFDPVTRGHEDLIRRSLGFVDRLVVAVAVNVTKQPVFSVAERVGFLRAAVGDDDRIEVREFGGLLVDFARENRASLLIRGLRAVSDFEYEYQMALMNRHLSPNIETVFMVPSVETTYISASLVREVARFGGALDELVHPTVAAALQSRFTRAGA